MSGAALVEVHHIFPKAWMRKQNRAGHPEIDTLANYAFLSKWDNINISDDDPATYLAKADGAVLRAQWIPLDPTLGQLIASMTSALRGGSCWRML